MAEEAEVPCYLLDPITYRLLEDPALAADGQTSSRASIQAHIDWCTEKGKPVTSPMTGEEMEARLVPNGYVRRVVEEFLAGQQGGQVGE